MGLGCVDSGNQFPKHFLVGLFPLQIASGEHAQKFVWVALVADVGDPARYFRQAGLRAATCRRWPLMMNPSVDTSRG